MSNPEVKNGTRWSAKRKAEVVLALLKGADVAELCRKNGISQSQLYGWRDCFLEGGTEQLKSRRGRKDPREREISRLERKVGQLTVQMEILREVAHLKKTKQLP
jgi:transposase